MLLAEGTIRIDPEGRDAALDALGVMIPATRAEPGCHAYRFAWDIDDATVLHVHEEWEDEDALAEHLASDHMRVFNRSLRGVLAAPPDMRVHTVASTRPMFEG